MKSLCCAVLLVVCAAPLALGQECCDRCDLCGCASPCRKVCRCVPEVKKTPKVTYSCECEDFCVPGPSQRSAYCDDCGKKQYVYTPTCAEVRTRKKLVKHETMVEKKTYKWVVETICDACACRQAASQQPGDEAQDLAAQSPEEITQASYQDAPAADSAPDAAASSPSVAGDLRRLLTPIFGRK